MDIEPYDIIVVGAGVVGLTAAAGLASEHCRVAVIDKGDIRHCDRNDGSSRVYAINQASQYLFETLDIWPLMPKEELSPYRHMHVWDARTQASIDFDANLVHRSELGFIIAESTLKRALLQKIQATNHISLFPLQTIEELQNHDSGITITSQTHCFETPLLLITDGANSFSRHKLNIPLTTWPYHQEALIATVQTEKVHNQTARQVFHDLGILAFLPLSDPKCCSIVWSTGQKQAQELKNCSVDAFNKALRQVFSDTLGSLALQGPRHHFPLHMRQAKDYVGPHWALLGDAAHTIHPMAGLGLNMGLADVAALLSLSKTAQRPQLSRKLLGAYQRERKAATWQNITVVGALKALFTNPLGPIATMRGLGLKICDNLAPLKRLLIEHANGQSFRQ